MSIKTYGKKVLILGANGQDGSYLTECLLKDSNFVFAVGKQKYSNFFKDGYNYRYIQFDINDFLGLQRLLIDIAPDVVYHLAATHGPAGFDYESVAQSVYNVNLYSLEVVLEYIRINKPGTRLFYASSSKVFVLNSKFISESSPRDSRCLYSLTKNLAFDTVNFYRIKYNVNATVIWFFNHESVRRPPTYFVPKLSSFIASAVNGINIASDFGNLNFWCDWGSAAEYMSILSTISNLKDCDYEDFIFATGITTNAHSLVVKLFNYFNMDPCDYISDFVVSDECTDCPWVVDISKLISLAKVQPKIDVYKICLDLIKNRPAVLG